jgi:hypothetical protein
MRYLVDEHDLDEPASLSAYRTLLAWAASNGDQFSLMVEPSVYDDSAEASRLMRLGQVSTSERAGSKRIEGMPGQMFVEELTWRRAPVRAISGDTCPVEEVVIFRGGRRFYACYDYGRTQVLDLTDEELADARSILRAASLDAGIIVRAPEYLTAQT